MCYLTIGYGVLYPVGDFFAGIEILPNWQNVLVLEAVFALSAGSYGRGLPKFIRPQANANYSPYPAQSLKLAAAKGRCSSG
jgi:hypothetical protein